MRPLLTLCLLLICLSNTYAQPMQKRLDSLANYYYETLDFNGTVLVAEKGKLLLNKGYGYQDKRKDILNTKDGIYLIGSVTKQFTAEIILMLAREGKLKLSDKLSKYFPSYAPGDSITLENLLTHTSGIFDYTQDSTWQTGKLDTPISDTHLFSLFRERPLQFAPGTDWQYSNTNYKLLGFIIEQTTGRTYYENVRERIFQPLGMTHSGFDFTHLQDKNKTTGYYEVQKDSFLVSIIVDSTQTNSAGAIYSTTGDMLKWHQGLQTYKLLDKAWQDKAYVPFEHNYGYGWEIDSTLGRRMLSHSGHIHGYNADFYHLPEDDVCIVILTNLMRTAADPVMYASNIVKALYDPGYAIPGVRKEIQLPEKIKQRYEGEYILTEDTTLHFTFQLKNKQLYLTVTGQPEAPLLPESETKFFTKMVDAQIEFEKNKEGTYDMKLYQYGQILEGKKMKTL